ncbi:MAG: hypothetical protein H7Z14_14940 [Anaerolineae bacterium]|nr:hypothetical protein [Phycisphaerae bacterium]
MGSAIRFARWVLIALLTCALPATYLTFALNRRSWTPEWIAFWIAVAMLAIGIALRPKWLRPDARAVRVIVIGGAALMIAVVVWNLAYADHVARPGSDTRNGEFRKNRNSRHWPIYGVAAFHGLPRALPAVAAMGGMVAFLIYAHRRNWPVDTRFLATLASVQLATTVAFAYSEERLTKPMQFDGFRYEIARFDDSNTVDVLRQYVSVQNKLGSFNSHYPPGFLLLMRAERLTHLAGIVGVLTLLVVPLTLFPLVKIVQSLRGSATAQRWAGGLFCTSVGVLIFTTLTPTALLIFLATSALCWLMLAITAGTVHRAIVVGIALGATTALYAFMSFSIGMLGLLMTAVVVLAFAFNVNNIRSRPKQTLIALLCSAAIFAGVFFLLYAATGFDYLACLKESRINLTKSNGNYFDSPERFALRFTGNLLAYLLSCGFVVAIPAFCAWPNRGAKPLQRVWVWAVPLALVVASGLGMGRLETERVWLFYTPAMCVAAAIWFARRDEETNRRLFPLVMIAAAIWACSAEILLHQY